MSGLTTAARMWLTRSVEPFRFTSENDEVLPYDDARNLGLYVHIPFCRSICSFCPYCKRVYDEALAHEYVSALKHEIELVCRDHPRREVTSLYFGGGTPALVADEVAGIICALGEHFEITDGVGLELHPDDVTPEKLRVLADAGVTRISIGVQSFSPTGLDSLGRADHDWDAMFTALAEVPFETVSMDFIFALPGQTAEALIADLERAYANGANHIAMYPFVDFSYTSRKFESMPTDERRALMRDVTGYLEDNGYVRDTIWTFAKPGTPRYSSMTRENFLGFGCSATTLLRDEFKVNTFSVPAYLERVGEGQLPSSLTIRFTERQRMVYWLFWTAYTMHIDARDFETFFGRTLEECYGAELRMLERMGYVEHDGTRWTMTPAGAWWYHYFEHHYTYSYIDQMWGLMRHEAFPSELVIR